MIRSVRRRLRPMYRSALLAMLWTNRRDVARWAKFAKRVAMPETRPSKADLKLEARVRAALSSDPLLRNDPSIRDLRVTDGIVVLEAPAEWKNKSLAITRVRQVKGVESVHTASDVNEQQWLGIDVLEPRQPAVV